MSIQCPKCKTENPPDSKFCNSCGLQFDSMDKIPVSHTKTLKTPQEKLTRGTLFADRYEIIDELGKGGMGKVYRVEDTKIKQEIALKLIKPDIAADKKTIERFKNELKTTRNIRHKNVCGMYDLGEDKGTHFITMEYVAGGDLRKLIRRTKQLTVGTAISIAKQICDGLAEAHNLGVVHRDLKPNNIMIDDNGNARIMDFGIARTLKDKGITGSGIMIGTPEYMSPEQVEGKEVDLRSDIYSLGIILCEMLTGRVPFEGDTPFTIGVKHKSEIPKDHKEFNSQIPDNLSRIILRCLEKEREKRFTSAEELKSELEAIEKGLPTAEQVSPVRKTATSKEVTVTFQKRWVFVIGFFIFAAVAVSIFLILNGGQRPTQQENKWLMVLPFTNLGQPEDAYLATGISREITNRLDPIPELNVKAYATAELCAKTDKTIPQIREELDVDYVVTGTMLWDKGSSEKGQVLVTWQLSQTIDEKQIDSDKIEIPFENISGVQGQVAEEIVKALDLKLLKPQRDALRANSTDNPEAYTSYHLAEEHFFKAYSNLDNQEFESAIAAYNTAVELDPNYIDAWSRLSYVQSYMYYTYVDRTQARLDKAKEAVNKALEVEPDNPWALLHHAYYYFWGLGDFEQALNIYDSVLKIRPNISKNLPSRIYGEMGRFEVAIELQKEQFDRNPLEESNANQIGMNYMQLRQYDEADIWINRALKTVPDSIAVTAVKLFNSIYWKGHTQDARLLLQQLPPLPIVNGLKTLLDIYDGKFEDALDELENWQLDFFELGSDYINKDLFLAYTYSRLNKDSLKESYANSARIYLEKLVQEFPYSPNYRCALGQAYALLGRKDEALREGEEAVELCPIDTSAQSGPAYVEQLVHIQILVGEYDEAIKNLDLIMARPAGRTISLPVLRFYSRYDPLRELPRFKQLLEKYSE